MEIAGRLVHDQVATGSKGERRALVLEADGGAVHLVRRRGAPAWGDADADLAELVGRRVSVTGTVVGGTLLVDAWRVID